MGLAKKIKRAFRGEVDPTTAILEAIRQTRATLSSSNERRKLEEIRLQPARLIKTFSGSTPTDLLSHFKSNERDARFFSGFSSNSITETVNALTQDQKRELEQAAAKISFKHCWPLLGFGEKCFGEEIQWNRDPLSGSVWPLDYHRSIKLQRGDGSDARVLWELNRLGHWITLARAFAVTSDARFSREFLAQLNSWNAQNPFGLGVNWNCAMEVALRAMNVLGAFEVFRHSSQFDSTSLALILKILQQHGTYIRRNLEFSYIATSNHYLSDVVGLLWLGMLLPELEDAEDWRKFGLQETLREMDKQILGDGADFESSTGYHRFVLELFLYSFILCRNNGIDIQEKYWQKLRAMLRYVRAYLRPDGTAPLIGDTDSGQVFPILQRRADDHAYLLAIGAAALNDPEFKIEGATIPEELLWILGNEAAQAFQEMKPGAPRISSGFAEAGTYILRDRDLYLAFNTSGAGIGGRGSHGHNDALSIEVFACGRSFIVDPGTYVYSADLQRRHQFRSTAYHSTVQIDEAEQNTTDPNVPFVIGDEAHPRVVDWETTADYDKVAAEHYGYARLASPVTHRRTVTCHKANRYWLIDDEFLGEGNHEYVIRFHFDAGLDVYIDGSCVVGKDQRLGTSLLVCPSADYRPRLEKQSTSRDYGECRESTTACWTISGLPQKLSWVIVPVCRDENEQERLNEIG